MSSSENRMRSGRVETAQPLPTLSWGTLLSCCASSGSSSRADEDPRKRRKSQQQGNNKNNDASLDASSSLSPTAVPVVVETPYTIRLTSNEQATDAFIADIEAGRESVLPTVRWKYRDVFQDTKNPQRHHLLPPSSSSSPNNTPTPIMTPLGALPSTLPPSPTPTRPPRTVLGARGMERVVSALLSKFEARDRLRQQHAFSTANEREPTAMEQHTPTDTTTPAMELAIRSPAHSINVLDLSNQCIGDEGAVALAALLVRDSYITSINLSHNYISERGMLALADAITRNCGSLQKVSLVDNDISNKAAVALFKAIKDLRHRLAETTAKKSLSSSGGTAIYNNGGRVGIQSLEIGFSSPETLMAIMTAQQASLKEKKSGSGGGDSTPRNFDHSRLHLSDDACIALSEACFCSADGFGSLTSQQCLPFTLKSLKIVNSPLSFTASSLGALVRGASSAVWASPDEQPSGGQYHVSWTYSSANRGSSVSPRDGPLCELSLVNCIDFGPLRSNENGIKAFTVPLCQSIVSPPLAYQQHALLSGGGLRQLELHHLPLADAGVQDIFYALITNERMRHKIIAAQQKSIAAAAAAVGGITTPISPTTTRNNNGNYNNNSSFEVTSPVATAMPTFPPNTTPSSSTGLVSISLSKSRFHQPLSLTTIADFIALNPPLRRLDISHCYAAPRKLISDGSSTGGGGGATLLHPIWNALATNKNLQYIDITGFPITTEDIKTVCDIFAQGLNTTLLTIDYAPNTILSSPSSTTTTASPSESARMLASCLLANASGSSSRGGHRSSSTNPARRGVSYGRQQATEDVSMPTSARDRRRSMSRGQL